MDIEDSNPSSGVKSYSKIEESLKEMLKYDAKAQSLCGNIAVELETTDSVLVLDPKIKSIRLRNKP